MLSFINKIAVKSSIKRLAQASFSREAFDNGVGMTFTTTEVFAGFYEQYGTEVKKHNYHYGKGFNFYTGFVRIEGSPEFLCVITLLPDNRGCLVSGFMPDKQYDKRETSDIVAKSMFERQVAQAMRETSPW